MDDLAATVIDQLKQDDGSSPFVALATWRTHHTDQWDHILIVPVTKNGTTSFNVLTLKWTVYGYRVDNDQFERDWNPQQLCNFANGEQAAQFLMATAKGRCRNDFQRDRLEVPLSIGLLNVDLVNRDPMYLQNTEGIADMLGMMAHMRSAVEA